MADIKEPLFTHTGTELTGPTETSLLRMSSIHYCTVIENSEDVRNAKVKCIARWVFEGLSEMCVKTSNTWFGIDFLLLLSWDHV